MLISGERVKHFREAAGFTKADLAIRMGVTDVMILRTEQGLVRRTRHMAEFCAALGVTIDDLTPDNARAAARQAMHRRNGRRVEKFTGDYSAEGEVIEETTLPNGKRRLLVAFDKITRGVIVHIVAPENVRPIGETKESVNER